MPLTVTGGEAVAGATIGGKFSLLRAEGSPVVLVLP